MPGFEKRLTELLFQCHHQHFIFFKKKINHHSRKRNFKLGQQRRHPTKWTGTVPSESFQSSVRMHQHPRGWKRNKEETAIWDPNLFFLKHKEKMT